MQAADSRLRAGSLRTGSHIRTRRGLGVAQSKTTESQWRGLRVVCLLHSFVSIESRSARRGPHLYVTHFRSRMQGEQVAGRPARAPRGRRARSSGGMLPTRYSLLTSTTTTEILRRSASVRVLSRRIRNSSGVTGKGGGGMASLPNQNKR